MKPLLLPFALAGLLAAAPKRRNQPEPPPEPAVPTQARIVDASDDTICLNTHPNKEILIRVPPGEVISNVDLGDATWRRSQFEKAPTPTGFLSIRCPFPGHSTTMHIITKSSDKQERSYGFNLTLNRKEPPDVTVIIKSTANAVDRTDPELLKAREELQQAQDRVASAVESREKADASVQAMAEQFFRFRRDYPRRLTVDYDINGNKKASKDPWNILGMFFDSAQNQTLVLHKEDTGDLPMLFAYDPDGKPVRVHGKYDRDANIYRYDQRLTKGYFTFGRRKLRFSELRSK
jgi:hypothetical protein